MSTSKKLRSPPPRKFDDYVFTRVISPDATLFPISNSKLKNFERPSIHALSPSDGNVDDRVSKITPIGFNFIFNGAVYTHFMACTNGWIILRENGNSFSLGDYFLTAASKPTYIGNSRVTGPPPAPSPQINRNELIRPNFISGGVLLCPWFDDLKTTTLHAEDLGVPDVGPTYEDIDATDLQKLRVTKGFDFPPYSYDEVAGAVKYANTTDAAGRQCLIVRWVAMCNYYNPLAVLTFEAVIYENGLVEFRYGKTKPVVKDIPVSSDLSYEGATIGIFVNDDPIYDWHFRDMSVGLGHPDDSARVMSKFGGAIHDTTSAYVDSRWNGASTATAVYNISMQACPQRPAANSVAYPSYLDGRQAAWPGQDKFNAIFRMSPPVARKKVLPKKELVGKDSKITLPLVARTGDSDRLGTALRVYDDRRSINFVESQNVDYPTSIPRFHGDTEAGVFERQPLFSDFDFVTSIVKSSADTHLGGEPVLYIQPFSDHGRPEQAPDAGEYFLTGSSVDEFGFSLKSSLKSKTQIKLELPIHHSLKMLETGSAIYYYNKNAKSLLMPQRDDANEDIVDPLSCLLAPSNLTNPAGFWPEDARGFGPIGNTISSGSNTSTFSNGWSSDPELGWQSTNFTGGPDPDGDKIWKTNKQARVLSKEYEKSTQNNPEYYSGDDEHFSLPINQPFLLEKAVFEIPIRVGRGWSEDRTTSSTPIGDVNLGKDYINIKPRILDFAGPAVTVSLFNQQETDLETHRDLILTGTIIPEGDSHKNIAVRQTWVWDTSITPSIPSALFLFEPEGFPSYNSTPSAVVQPDYDGQFTGSVVVQTVAGISNGVVLGHTVKATDFSPAPAHSVDWASAVIGLMTSSTINVDYRNESNSYFWSGIKSIDPLGRNSKGFKPSGRSVFGKEFETLDHEEYKQLPNPLFVSSSFDDFPLALKNVLDVNVNPEFQAFFQFAVPVVKSQDSPYLIMPGDKLTLALSKMRPAIHTNGYYPDLPNTIDGGNPPELDPWRHGLRHDIWITTGSIKMTLYGSLLREEKEFHDTLNQPLASDAIHEMLGAEPICDQHDVEYREMHYGAFSDDYITGSLASRAPGSKVIVTGSRGRLFSRLNARNQPPLDSTFGGYEVSVNPSKAFRLQPWFERTGDQRTARFFTTGERFYDSLMPAFDECFSVDGTPLFIISDITDMYPTNATKAGSTYGGIIFDLPADGSTSTPVDDVAALTNNVWNWSYPFEPRYAEIQRQLDLNKREFFTAKSIDDLYTANTITTFPIAQKIDDLIFMRRSSIFDSNFIRDIVGDVDLSKKTSSIYSTGSMTRDDIARVLYGFGDNNTVETVTLLDATEVQVGHNHQPQFREVDRPTSTRSYSFGPIIRGWKYGVYSALPSHSSVVFRRSRFGHFRDMLEQRLFSKYYQTEPTPDSPNVGALSPAVVVKFVDINGNTTSPELTWSQNLSFEVTSSLPYEDGAARNRPPIDISALNNSIILAGSDSNNLII